MGQNKSNCIYLFKLIKKKIVTSILANAENEINLKKISILK